MTDDVNVLRQLAGAYALLCQEDRFRVNRHLHRAVSDLKPIRPVVLIDELPWTEMNIDDELTLVCADPALRAAESLAGTVPVACLSGDGSEIGPPPPGGQGGETAAPQARVTP